MKLAVIVGIVSIITKVIMVACTKERVIMEEITHGERPDVKTILKAVIHNKYWIMVTIMLCAGSAIQTGTASVASYYAQYVLGDPSLVGTLLSAFLLPPIAGFLLAGILMQKFSRKPVLVAAVIIGMAGALISIISNGSFTAMLAGLACRGFGYSMIMGVGNSMASDTVEYGHWKTGVRTQGVLMSGKGLGDKLSVGLLTGIIGWVMGAAGYDGTLAVQPASAVSAINGLFLYTPVILLIIIAVFLYFYDLDKHYPKIMKELEQRERGLKKE
ncbi:MAG TPA: MFS transporter [Candidatus Mediterraneibacter norfolkensis]|nr:MFS transporter [Candidatus Mediterraneibacter norfolkensis]